VQSSSYQKTRHQSPTIGIFIAIAFSISNTFFLFAPFSSVPCFSCLFISEFCFVLLLLSLYITFLLTRFFSSYHVQYVKCLSTYLLFSSTSPLFIYLSFFLTSSLPYFLSLLLFSRKIIYFLSTLLYQFFPRLYFHLFFICLYYFHSLSLLFLFFSPFHSTSLLQFMLNIPTGVKHDYGATCLCQFPETQMYRRRMTWHIQYKIHEP